MFAVEQRVIICGALVLEVLEENSIGNFVKDVQRKQFVANEQFTLQLKASNYRISAGQK
jgi:hypothetical protein